MKKAIGRIYRQVILITLALTVLTLGMVAVMEITSAQEHLRVLLAAASAWTTDSAQELEDLARHIAASSDDLRVTFLMPNGLVLADSHQAAAQMESHAQRPEVLEALTEEVGQSLRLSETMEYVPTLYAAKQLSPLLIIRVAYPLWDALAIMGGYAGVMAMVTVLLVMGQRLAVRRFVKQLTWQLTNVRRLLEGSLERGSLDMKAFYPEIRPAMENISYLIERLQSDLRTIHRTQSLRRDFVANASHELKSPLTSIQGFAEMLAEGMYDTPQEEMEYLQRILRESQRMRGVIDDILTLSKLEKEVDEPRKEVDGAAIAREVMESLKPQAMSKGITLGLEGRAVFYAVEREIWEIFYNLISNAIRYGRPDGWVRITVALGQIRVEDNGVGIEKEHLPLLFEQFYRVDKAHSRQAGGTGLGLSIVWQIMNRYGGDVRVESVPGEGSVFTCRFPQRRNVRTV